VQEVVRAVRNLRTEKRVPPSRKVPVVIAAGERLPVLQSQQMTIAFLASIDPGSFQLESSLVERPQNSVALTVMGIEIYLPLEGLVDTEAERVRLQKELEEIDSQTTRLEALLNSPFAERAPAQVVERERLKLATFKETAARLRDQLAGL
jgi:valyl-tRNA synthetase